MYQFKLLNSSIYIHVRESSPSIYVHPSLKAHNSNIINMIWTAYSSVWMWVPVKWESPEHRTLTITSITTSPEDSALCNISIRKHEKGQCGVRDKWRSAFIWKLSTPQQMRETQNTNENAALEGPREVGSPWVASSSCLVYLLPVAWER